MTKQIIKGTILSILIFFSISFLTILFQINSPQKRTEGFYELSIGFPYEYYHEFMLNCPIPNSGWNGECLIIDCLLTWGITMLLLIIVERKNKNKA